VGQIDSTLIEQRQGVGGGLGVDLTGIALQRGDAGRGGGGIVKLFETVCCAVDVSGLGGGM
jgi:hypothetical protein